MATNGTNGHAAAVAQDEKEASIRKGNNNADAVSVAITAPAPSTSTKVKRSGMKLQDERTSRVVWAGVVLAANAGFVNSLGMMGIFDQVVTVSHLTGVSTRIGINLTKYNSNDRDALEVYCGLVFSFMAGSFTCGTIIGKGQVNLGVSLYGMALCLVSVLMLFAWGFADGTCGKFFAAAAMGLQNGLATQFSGAVVRTSHVTGIFTDVGLLTGRLFGRFIRGGCSFDAINCKTRDDVYQEFFKLKVLVFLASGFIIGAMCGSAAFEEIGRDALILPIVLTAVMGASYTYWRTMILHQSLLGGSAKDAVPEAASSLPPSLKYSSIVGRSSMTGVPEAVFTRGNSAVTLNDAGATNGGGENEKGGGDDLGRASLTKIDAVIGSFVERGDSEDEEISVRGKREKYAS